MLNIHVDATKNVITARPEGFIPASEFEALGQAIDDYANERDRMPGLVVHLKGLPQWRGLSAMKAHFDVVRKHAMVLPRVAIVTDTMGLAVLPNLADIFVRARVRHFDVRQEDEAVAWAGSPEKEPEGYVLLDGYPDNVIAIRAVGEVTSRDYEDRLIPLVRKMEAVHGGVRLLMQLGPDFENYTAGAMWDDARLGLTHWRSFERVAVVSDIGWITRGVKMFAPLMPGEVAVFPNDALDAAKAWITEGAPAVDPVAPAVEPAAEPAATETPEPAPKAAPPAASKPAAVAAPAAQPRKPATRTAAKPAARAAAKPAAQTASKPADKPAPKPAAKPAATAAKPAAKPAARKASPATKPEAASAAAKPAARKAPARRIAARKPASKPADKPADKPGT